MSNHVEAIRKRSDDQRDTRSTAVVSLCAHRQSVRAPLMRLVPSVSGARKPSVATRAGETALALAGAGLLMLLWPVAKLAGVFAWSDADERG